MQTVRINLASGLCPVAYFSFDDPGNYTWMKISTEIEPPEFSQVDGKVSVDFYFPFIILVKLLSIYFRLKGIETCLNAFIPMTNNILHKSNVLYK